MNDEVGQLSPQAIYLLEKEESFVILGLNIAVCSRQIALLRRKKQVLDDPFLSGLHFITSFFSVPWDSHTPPPWPIWKKLPLAIAPPSGKTQTC